MNASGTVAAFLEAQDAVLRVHGSRTTTSNGSAGIPSAWNVCEARGIWDEGCHQHVSGRNIQFVKQRGLLPMLPSHAKKSATTRLAASGRLDAPASEQPPSRWRPSRKAQVGGSKKRIAQPSDEHHAPVLMNDPTELSSPLRDAHTEGAIHTQKEGGKERSTSPFAKLGALLEIGARIGGDSRGSGIARGPERGNKPRARFLRLWHEGSAIRGGRKDDVAGEKVQKGGVRESRAAFLAGTPGVQARNTQGNGQKPVTAGVNKSSESGGASTSGRTSESACGTKEAVSKVGSRADRSLHIADEALSVKRGLLSGNNSSSSADIGREMVEQDAEVGYHSDEAEQDPQTPRAAEAGLSGPPDDWFDVEISASTNESERPAESTSVAESEAADTTTDIQADREATALRRQVSTARQTADVSAWRQTPKVATSRILEASDYMDASSGDLFLWDDDDNVAPAVPIYRKQPRSAGGDGEGRTRGGGARAPRKREPHKAKTHEDHRRRAHERKSQLASAGLPLHLEAEEHVETEVAPKCDAKPEGAATAYRGMRCEVCRRLRKGGCGTGSARPGCLKRLLLHPQSVQEEEEIVPSGEEDADVIRTSLGLPALARPMIGYLTSLGFAQADLVRLLDKNASTFRLSVGPVKGRVDFLLASGVDLEGLRTMVHKHPSVLRYRVDRVMQPRIDFLKQLGVPEDEIARVITTHPSLLELSAENLEPKVKFLTHSIGIPAEKVVEIVRRHPQLLEKSIETGLQPKVDYFVKQVGVPRAAFAKMVSRHPQLLQYSIENGIKPRMDFLRSIGFTSEERVTCISKFAQLLSLSVDTCLRPKYEYLVSHLGGTTKTVVDFPAYFSLSLEKRIMPRYKDLCQLDPGGAFPTSLFMWMLRLTDDRFALEVAKRKRSKQKHAGEVVVAHYEPGGEESYSQKPMLEGYKGDTISKELRQVEDIGVGQSAGKAEVEEKAQSSYQTGSDDLELEGAIAAAVAPTRFLDTEGRPGRFRRKVAW